VRNPGHNSKIPDLMHRSKIVTVSVKRLIKIHPGYTHMVPDWDVINSIPEDGYVNEDEITILTHDAYD
jgi:hypothetical protein